MPYAAPVFASRTLRFAFPIVTTICWWGSVAWAGVEHWELSEVHPQSDGDPQIRFVELVNHVGGCLFPSTTLDLYDGAGLLLDTMSLSVITTCYGAPTYFLLATQQASGHFGVSRDANLFIELPSSGQLCLASSATNYDCVRWGQITTAIVDLFGAGDSSAVPAPVDGNSLERVLTSHIVNDDWLSDLPTPKQPNDGSIWEIPDAGPSPDAAPIVDAGPRPDAARRSDAGPGPDARPDAQNTRYLDLDTVGGASCACGSTGTGSFGGSAGLLLLAVSRVRRRRRRPDD